MKYYLIDTSALIYLYIPDTPTKKITRKIEYLLQEKQKGNAFLFVPNFCIAEAFNTFAKYHYRYKKTAPDRALSDGEYKLCCDKFQNDIKDGRIFYPYEMNNLHLSNVDFITPFEHQWFLEREKEGKKEDWCLSTFDILFISMGLELVRIVGRDNLFFVTRDKRINQICNILRTADSNTRRKYKIPDYIICPNCLPV
ncbi:MAG: hypothetical protein ABIK20_02760 [Candidatus Omnitrophota bacterium]